MKRETISKKPSSGANLKGFQLRQLRRSELGRFVELGFPTCSFLHGRKGISKRFQKQQFREFVNKHAFEEGSEIYVLADESNQIIGQLWLHTTHNLFNGQKELWIWDITIDEPHRGSGVGKRLLELADRRAVELNCQELWLLVAEDNSRAREVYETFGMADAGRVMKLPIGAEKNPTSSLANPTVSNLGDVVIRPLTEKDIGPMLQLWRDAELDHRPYGRDTAVKLLAELRANPGLFWGAFDNNRIVGSIFGTSEGRRKGWINRLAVHPDYQRKGIAQTLVAVCEKALQARGIKIIAGFVMEGNDGSMRMFESCGYKLFPGVFYYTKRENEDV